MEKIYFEIKNKSLQNRLIDIENKLIVTKGEGVGGRDKLGVWD